MVGHVSNAWQARDPHIQRGLGNAGGVLIKSKQPVPVPLHDFERHFQIGVARGQLSQRSLGAGEIGAMRLDRLFPYGQLAADLIDIARGRRLRSKGAIYEVLDAAGFARVKRLVDAGGGEL